MHLNNWITLLYTWDIVNELRFNLKKKQKIKINICEEFSDKKF